MKWFSTLCMMLGVMLFGTVPAQAQTKFMQIGAVTSAPNIEAWRSFCSRHPAECNRHTRPARVELNDVNISTLRAIVARLDGIPETSDMECFGRAEHLAYPTRCGDCDDIALQAQKWLTDAGWPAGALLMTLAYDPRHKLHHYVLSIETTDGTYILDGTGQTSFEPWYRRVLLYRWRQSANSRNSWVSIVDTHNPAEIITGSIN